VPWELAFDGEEFLLNKFRIGRQVLTHQPVPPADGRRPQNPDRLKMLIIADPSETLDAAAEEADQLVDMLDTCHNLEVSILGGRQLRKINLLQALNDCDLVHYAGHACFDENDPSRSGWVLRDSVLMASELRRVPRPPLLVFSNACQAGATTRWQSDTAYDGQAFGIGSAFLLAGTQNYIGTFCAIHDAHSATFAADFYQLSPARRPSWQRPRQGPSAGLSRGGHQWSVVGQLYALWQSGISPSIQCGKGGGQLDIIPIPCS
jgi:CHAT domain-containing protein